MTKGPWILVYKEIQELEKHSIQAGFKLLYTDNNKKIIYGAAKRLHIMPFHPNYDDFIQEGALSFVQAYVRYPDNIEQNLEKFRVFAYQAVYWRLLDLIRQTNRHAERIQSDQDALNSQVQSNLDHAYEDIYHDQLFRHLYQNCTKSERLFLIDCYVLQLKGSEIAKKHHVTRQCVSNWRRTVGNKALAYISKSNQ